MKSKKLKATRYHIQEEEGNILAEKGSILKMGSIYQSCGSNHFFNWVYATLYSGNVC